MKTQKEKDELRLLAKNFEAKWKKEGKILKELRHRHIFHSIYLYRKKDKYYPTIRVGCRHHIDKIRYTKSLHVGRDRTFREAWKECANFFT